MRKTGTLITKGLRGNLEMKKQDVGTGAAIGIRSCFLSWPETPRSGAWPSGKWCELAKVPRTIGNASLL